MATIVNELLPQTGMLTNVRLEYQPDNQTVALRWNWPEDPSYKYCFIFCVAEEEDIRGITLEELLATQKQHRMRIVGKKDYFDCREKISQSGTRFYLYPAKEDPASKERLVYEQSEGNKSEFFRKKKQIRVSLARDLQSIKGKGLKGLFSGKGQKETIRYALMIEGDTPEGGGYLTYHIEGGDSKGVRFGLDLESFYRRPVCLYLQEGETLVIDPPEEELARKYAITVHTV